MSRESTIWRAGERLVVRVGARYCVIDATGRIVERWEPSQSSRAGFVVWMEYAIVEDSLVETEILGTLSGTDESDRVVIAGLVAVDDPDTRTFVNTVLDDDLVADEERRLRETNR